MKKGIIIVIHGSKHQKSHEVLTQLCEKIRLDNIYEFDMVKHAYLEFETPTVEMVFEKMADNNINAVYVYPYFLNAGKHVSVDIPQIVIQMQEMYPKMKIETLEHFGSSKSIVSIISADLKAII